MVVPNSSHAAEFTLITPVLDTSTPISYIVNGENRTIRGTNGQIYSLRKNSTWEPLPTTPGEAHTLTVVSSVITEGSKTYTTEIYASNRTMQPSRWRSKCVDGTGVVYDRFWLRRGGGDLVSFISPQPTPPAGGATDFNERWWERYWVTGTNPATMAFHHNPTMGGAGDRPDGSEIPPDLGVSSKMYTGRPITYTARAQESLTSPAFIEGACAPLDFGGDPGNFEYSDHGYGSGTDAEDQPAWWWRMRMWRRFYPNYNNMPRITKSEGASWFPVEWNNDGISNPIVVQFVENFDLVPSAFNKCYLINVSSGQYQELSTVYTTLGGGVTGAGYFSQHNIMRHRTVFEYDATVNLPAQSQAIANAFYPPYDSPYLALAYLDTNTGFCFAVATKLEKCTNESEDSRDDTDNACQLQAWHREYTNTTPLLETSNEGDIAYVMHKSRIRRKAGWLFRKTFIYTGEFTNVISDFQSLFNAGEFYSELTVADIPQSVLNSLRGDPFKFTKPLDRGQLHPFVATLHYIGEQRKLLQASAYYHLNPSSFDADSKWKNVLHSYANDITEFSGAFPNSFDDYINFSLGRDIHKFYYEYNHTFNNHRVSKLILDQNGPNILAHALGSLLYNSDFTERGSLTLQNPALITTDIANTINFTAGQGIFSESGTTSGTYIASSILNIGQGVTEFRNSGILSHIEFCQPSGASDRNSFAIIDIDPSLKSSGLINPLLHDNVLIKQSAYAGFGRIIFDISKYQLDSQKFDVQTNFLSPEHEFNIKFKTTLINPDGLSLGGGTIGVWIHTKPELDKVWSYTPQGTWINHSASGLDLAKVINYSHLVNIPYKTRDITVSSNYQCLKFLDQTNTNRSNDVIASLREDEFTEISLNLHTRNYSCEGLDITSPTEEYLNSISNNIHRINQNYVIELFTIPTQDDRFTLYYGMSMVDLTLNRMSKPLVTKLSECKELRIDLSKDQLLNIIKYFNQIRGEYSTVGYNGVNNLTGYASRVASTTQGFYETSGGSRINYVEDPSWQSGAENGYQLRETINLIN